MIITTGLIIAFIPSIYFSTKLVSIDKEQSQELLKDSQKEVVSIFNVRESEPDERDLNIFKKNSSIFCNFFFMFLMMVRCINSTEKSMIQFWLCKYTITLNMNNKPLLTCLFALMIIGNPLLGSIIGGKFINWVGGYKDKNCVLKLMFIQFLACLVFTPAPYFEDWRFFLIFTSLYQIVGMSVLPALDKVKMDTVPKDKKKKASNVNTIMNQFLGGLPAPPVYGLIAEFKNSYDKHYAMKCYMYYLWTTMFWLIVAQIYKSVTDKEKEKEDKGIELEDK